MLPSPFSIALILTAITLILALTFTSGNGEKGQQALNLLLYWEKGLWNANLLVFAFQMMLMLVLGHILALSHPVDRFLQLLTQRISNGSHAVAMVAFVAILVGFFNWGLALIVGAVFARKVGEHFLTRNIPLNYPLVGAAGYAGLLVWHGGISGSSLVKVAEKGHIASLVSPEFASLVPEAIQFDETVFGSMNMVVSILLLLILTLIMYLVAKKNSTAPIQITRKTDVKIDLVSKDQFQLDSAKWFLRIFGILLFIIVGYQFVQNGFLKFFTPNRINLLLLMLVFLMHQNAASILHALDDAIQGASGILLQFPLYFGVMGIANQSGLLKIVSEGFVSLASAETLPIFTFISAGLVNIFVPSGGGQWIIQGPVILDAAIHLQSSLSKNIMALAYGDQLTNMLQPFWALPLLGITGLKAQEILPYTLILFIAGATIFVSVLLIF